MSGIVLCVCVGLRGSKLVCFDGALPCLHVHFGVALSVCVVCACAGAIFDCFVGVWQFVCSHVVLRTEACAGALTCFDGVWHAFWSEASVARLFWVSTDGKWQTAIVWGVSFGLRFDD